MTNELLAVVTETSPPVRSVTWPSGSLAFVAFILNDRIHGAGDLSVADGEGLPDVEFHFQAGEAIASHHHWCGEVDRQCVRRLGQRTGHRSHAGGFWLISTQEMTGFASTKVALL